MIEKHFPVFEQKHRRAWGLASKMKGEERKRIELLPKI
jgi:hypothetical protein